MSPTLGTRFADSIDVDRILCLPHLLASLQFQNTLPRPISCPRTTGCLNGVSHGFGFVIPTEPWNESALDTNEAVSVLV
jgi:hypothetical protein